MTNCECKRLVGPYGTWSREDLIGAHVIVASMPVSNYTRFFASDQVYTIEDIYFRVSNDGKAITIIILKECPGMFFTWKDLDIKAIRINNGKESEQSEENKS
ncbi:MAG: hypothetical protein J6I84_04000 [Bacilli bacterium]|nr:hypothetical protein [Bacilli bacterium]